MPAARPPRIFFSVGEPSGDLHGANLIRQLQARCPGVEAVGYGGPKMAAAGCRLHADLTALAVMWFGRALLNIEGPRHPRLLLHAAANLGLGAVARQQDAAVRRPRALQPALRGAVVPGAGLQRHVRRPSVLRRGAAAKAR
jgi:hypothetical protein